MGDKTGIGWTDATWRDVPGWPGFRVTAGGDITGPSGRLLKPMRHRSGHLFVTRGRNSNKLYVHRAVLLAFVGAPRPGHEGRHLNGVPHDNRLVNLAWGTPLEQRADDRRNGVERGKPQALTTEGADLIRALKGKASARAVANDFGVSHTAVLRIWRGQTWATGRA